MLRELVCAMALMIVSIPAAVRSQEPVAPPANEPALADTSKEAAEYRALLEQPPEKLADLCRQRGVQLLADLQFGRAIAKGEIREQNLETTRAELLAQAAEKRKQYETLRDQVYAERDRIRQRFSEDSAECDRRLYALYQRHHPAAERLRDEAKQLEELAAKKDSRLSQVRSELATLRENIDMLAQGHQLRRSETPLDLVDSFESGDAELMNELGLDPADLGLVGLGDDAKRTTVAKPVTAEQVRQAGDEFDSLFRR